MFEYEKLSEEIAAIAAHHAAATDGGAFPTAPLDAMRAAGLLGLVSAEGVGGHGLGLPAAAFVVERLARACGSTAMVACMHYCATAVIEQLGPTDVRTQIAAGRHLATLAFSEVGSRSHFWAPVGTATADGDHARLTARKSWVTSARHADSYVWSSKPLAGGELSTLWLVPRTTPGLRIADAGFDGLGLRGNDSSPVTAEAARVPMTARLGTDGAGFATMMGTVLPWFNVLTASVACGLMETAVQRTAAHAGGTSFEHAGSRLADLPTIRAYVARMRIATDHNKALVADTIAAIASGRADATLRVLESKAAAGESAVQVTDLAMRVCGGAAFRKDGGLGASGPGAERAGPAPASGIERVFRDARAGVVMGPTTDVLYDFIGKAVCGLPLF